MNHTIYATSFDGSIAKITGPSNVLEAVTSALVNSGWVYRDNLETWDEGFYGPTLSEAYISVHGTPDPAEVP